VSEVRDGFGSSSAAMVVGSCRQLRGRAILARDRERSFALRDAHASRRRSNKW